MSFRSMLPTLLLAFALSIFVCVLAAARGSTVTLALAAGLFAKWLVREGHTLELNNVYFQTLDDDEFRVLSRLDWKIRLPLSRVISLKLSISNEYDSASEKSKDNLKYSTSLAFDL